MSSYSYVFLFDYSSFVAKIAYPLNILLSGSSEVLQQTAIQLLNENPEVVDLLDLSHISFHAPFERKIEDVINAGVLSWLLVVIFNYCSEFTRPVGYKISSQTFVAETSMLPDERPLGDLLIKVNPKIVPTDYLDGEFNINDCPLSWFSFEDIEIIKASVQANITSNNIPVDDQFIIMLDKAIASKKTLIFGHWFN